jgi:hypothetical protein
MRGALITRIRRDCVRREVERVLMRFLVIRLIPLEWVVKERAVLSSMPRTRYISEGSIEGSGTGYP